MHAVGIVSALYVPMEQQTCDECNKHPEHPGTFMYAGQQQMARSRFGHNHPSDRASLKR